MRARTAWIAGCTLALSGVASGQQGSNSWLIDFEEYVEQTPISTQYSATGAFFSIVGDDLLLPIIAEEGVPRVAFGGPSDRPLASGIRGLTDPVINGDYLPSNAIAISFHPPVTSVRLLVSDIDNEDVATLRAFDEDVEVAMDTVAAGETYTGNGAITDMFVASSMISRVEFAVTTDDAANGWAIDYVTFTRPCSGDVCGPLTEIAQESAPGKGDFDANVLGTVLSFPTPGSAAQFYAYDFPVEQSWSGQKLTPVADRSHVLLADTIDGLTLAVVHDRAVPDDGDGGRAETRIEFLMGSESVFRSVEDGEAEDVFTGNAGDAVFTAENSWAECCTDGFALSGIGDEWSAYLQFADVDGDPGNVVIDGLTEWVVYSADGSEIPLALNGGQRVRLRTAGCSADCNGDGILNVLDFVCFQLEWQRQTPKGDCDGNQAYNVLDFVCFQTVFQAGCM